MYVSGKFLRVNIFPLSVGTCGLRHFFSLESDLAICRTRDLLFVFLVDLPLLYNKNYQHRLGRLVLCIHLGNRTDFWFDSETRHVFNWEGQLIVPFNWILRSDFLIKITFFNFYAGASLGEIKNVRNSIVNSLSDNFFFVLSNYYLMRSSMEKYWCF